MNAVSGARRSARCRTPVVFQTETSECGVACLRSILAYYGRWVPMGALREACGVGRDGCSGADLLRAARTFGLDARGWKQSLERIHEVGLPAILYWEFNHFVILEGTAPGRYYLNDPARGRRVVDEDEFDRGFTGVLLRFARGPEFRPGARPPGVLSRLWRWMRDFKPALVLTGLLGLMLAFATLLVPLLLTVLVDRVLGQGQVEWGGALVLAMAGLGVVTYLLTWLQMRVLRRLAIAVAITWSDRCLTHLFRLPLEFFGRRLTGDLLTRVQLIDFVARQGVGQLVSVAVEVVMCLAFLAVMLAYDAVLALAVLALAVLCALATRLVARLRTDCNHLLRHEQGRLAGLLMAGLRSLEPMRATGSESRFFARWGGYQADELRARQSFEELGHAVDAMPGLFLMLGSALVLGFGGWQVVSGSMSVGGLVGFYVLTGNFLRPVGRLMRFTNNLETLDADLWRLEDVFSAEPTAAAGIRDGRGSERVATLNGRLQLTGRVELRNVTFGFQRNRPPLIENFSLTVQPGERVAVVGPTGSGKTSLALLVAGVYRPWSGDILFDGHRAEDIPPDVLRESVAMVDQNPVLFGATVRENLTLWDPTVPDRQVVDAARDADIHDVIVDRPGAYDARVEEGARNFSGGEQQRLEIARALVRRPSVLVLDEATSSLDPSTEVRIDQALRRRACSCLIVAHRLSTIRDSDLIVVLQDGREVQRGRHDELLADGGLYRRLIDAS